MPPPPSFAARRSPPASVRGQGASGSPPSAPYGRFVKLSSRYLDQIGFWDRKIDRVVLDAGELAGAGKSIVSPRHVDVNETDSQELVASLLGEITQIIRVTAESQDSRVGVFLALVRHRVRVTHFDKLDAADFFAGRVNNPVTDHDVADGTGFDRIRIHFAFRRIVSRHREWIALAHR